MKVCHFITNPYSRDTRVIKECKSLVEIGYSVDVVAYWREGFPTSVQHDDGVRVIRTRPGWKYFSENCLAPVLRRFGRRHIGGRGPYLKVLDKRRWRRAVQGGRGFFKERLRPWKMRLVRLRRTRVQASLEDQVNDARASEITFSRNQTITFVLLLASAPILLPLLLVGRLLLSVTRIAVQTLRALGRIVVRGLRRRRWIVVPEAVKFLKAVFFTRNYFTMVVHGWLADADVYQANDPDTLLVAWTSARLRGARLVYDSHELFDESFPTRKPLFVRFAIRALEGAMARRADHVLTVNKSIAEILGKRYKLSEQPTVLRNAQPLEQPIQPNDHLRTACGNCLEGKNVMVYAGRVTKGRGLENIIDAFPMIDSSAVLVIMGGGDPKMIRSLRNRIETLSLDERVKIIEPVPSDEVSKTVASADIGLMLTQTITLSSYYGLGNKLFHYINAGVPVLVSDQPEKRALIEEYDVGWWVASLESEALAVECNKILADETGLRKKKKNCVRAAPRISWEEEVKSYIDIYVKFFEERLFSNDVY